jgi:hypothetical protein
LLAPLDLFPPLLALRLVKNVKRSIADFDVRVVGYASAVFGIFHRFGGNVDRESAELERLGPFLRCRRHSLTERGPQVLRRLAVDPRFTVSGFTPT